MIKLHNDCHIGKISINPSNYKTCGREELKKDWYFEYRFYDPLFREIPKYKYGMKCRRKGPINDFNTLKDRRVAMDVLIEYEIEKLKKGWHPIRKKIVPPTPTIQYEIDPGTPIIEALDSAVARMDLSKTDRRRNVESVLKYVKLSIHQLGLDKLEIQNLRRRHVKSILEHIGHIKVSMEQTYSNNNYNHHRRYLSIIVNELVEYESIEFNPVHQIRKKSVTRRIRQTLTAAERKKVYEHLSTYYPNFWRFVDIFFHSGRREIELLHVKKHDIDIPNQRFKVTQRKGKQIFEVWAPIKNAVLDKWTELYNEAAGNEYIFSDRLEPGPIHIDRKQISRRWRVHVKNKLNITADLYSLKHTNLDETEALLGIEMAKQMAGHKSTKTTEIYTVGKKGRKFELLKNLDNKFA